MNFGHGRNDFLIDSPLAVAQAVYTRLCLWQGEWWLNLQEGTPWMQQILGHRYSNVPDGALRSRILSTPYVTRMEDYASNFDPASRHFSVSCKLFTAFGQVTQAPTGTTITSTGALVMPLGNQPTSLLNARTLSITHASTNH